MWSVNGQDLKMCEGDYGLQLPIKISGTNFSQADEVRLTIKKAINGDVVLEKVFSEIEHNTINLEFTESESALFPVGSYCYGLDWYQDGVFMCNIIPVGQFRVVDKA